MKAGSGYTAQDPFLNNISTVVHQLICWKLLTSDDLIIFMFHYMNNFWLGNNIFCKNIELQQGHGKVFCGSIL
jgi:hypothetical protein